MKTQDEIAGAYIGRFKVREGSGAALNEAERKRYLKDGLTLPLELRADGTFLYKCSISGEFELDGGVVRLRPREYAGKSEQAMREACESDGRQFTLGWLFRPFELELSDGVLIQPCGNTLVTEFRKR